MRRLPQIETEIEVLANELWVLGTDRLVVGWIEPPTTAADADVVEARILEAAEQAAEAGLRLGFHNHDGELALLDDGSSLLGRLLGVESGKLFLELDLGWVWYAGSDPFALLERAGGQAPLVHVKDLRKRGGGPVHLPLGAGDVGYGRLLETVGRVGVEWLILEQDETHGRGFEAVGESLAELTRLSGLAASS